MPLLLPVPLPLTAWRGSSAARETRRAQRARAGPLPSLSAARQGRHSWSNRIAICRRSFIGPEGRLISQSAQVGPPGWLRVASLLTGRSALRIPVDYLHGRQPPSGVLL